MSEDILERAKKALIDDDMTYEDYDECISLLIAEVERLRSFRGRIARILGQSPSDCDDLLIVGLDSRIILAKRLTARIKELQDLIDKPPEEADWVADYHLLQSALDGPIIDAARKWHAAYRKAQNSNLMRAKEVERLRSTPKSGLYGKYIIQKADGSPVDPKADYFILRLDTDPIARRAALEYSYFMASGKDIQLAKDLQARVAKYDPKSEDAVYLRYIGVQKNEVVEQLESTKAEVGRLRSVYLAYSRKHDENMLKVIARNKEQRARIKELEAIREAIILALQRPKTCTTDGLILYITEDIKYLQDQIPYLRRLEAAFLDSLAARLYYEHYPGVSDAYSWHDYPEEACHSMPKEEFRKKAHEALERIKEKRG